MPTQEVQPHFPAIFSEFSGLVAAESTRLGGVSAAPYDSLNLGKSTDDNPENVLENRRRFCAALGFTTDDLAYSFQVHGTEVRCVDAPGAHRGYDALITNKSGILLAVSIADCVPILIFDRTRQAMAAIHAGWKGSAAKLVSKTLDALSRQFGTRGEDCFAYIGTCIDHCAFEVGPEVAENFDPAFTRWDEALGKHFIDLKAANKAQCIDFGIPENQIGVSPYSTVEHNHLYFSHRKNKGVTGRMMACIGLRPPKTSFS